MTSERARCMIVGWTTGTRENRKAVRKKGSALKKKQ